MVAVFLGVNSSVCVFIWKDLERCWMKLWRGLRKLFAWTVSEISGSDSSTSTDCHMGEREYHLLPGVRVCQF